MRRKQTRYTTEEEIIRKIDKAKLDCVKWRTKLETGRLTEQDRLLIIAKVRRVEDSTLPNLKCTLAAFRTMLLPGVTEDAAVVLQRQ